MRAGTQQIAEGGLMYVSIGHAPFDRQLHRGQRHTSTRSPVFTVRLQLTGSALAEKITWVLYVQEQKTENMSEAIKDLQHSC